MSEKERMTSVFTAAPRTVLLSETTDRLKLEVPDASQQPRSCRELLKCLRFNSSTEWCTSQSCNRCRANCADDCGAPAGAVLGQGCGHPRGW